MSNVYFCLSPQSKPARIAHQRAVAKAHKPWLKSTGPRTESGKRRSSQNRMVHGARSRDFTQVRRALREAEEALLTVMSQTEEPTNVYTQTVEEAVNEGKSTLQQEEQSTTTSTASCASAPLSRVTDQAPDVSCSDTRDGNTSMSDY